MNYLWNNQVWFLQIYLDNESSAFLEVVKNTYYHSHHFDLK